MFSKKHTRINRNLYSYVGNVNNHGVFIKSGSVNDITGSVTGSVTLNFDAEALKIKRVEVFHSGAATTFTVRLENSVPNTGSFFDPRNVVLEYKDIPGSPSFLDGLDQIEDLFCLTDQTSPMVGNLVLKVIPSNLGSELNSFKYLLFCEAAFVYVQKDGTF